MNCQQKSRFSFFPRAFKNRDPKSSKKSSPGSQNEPQELLRRSQERPKRPQDGPKSRQERPKRRPRAARSAPKGPQARPWAPKVRQEALREAPGAHVGLILGGPGLHFQAIEASFSKLARAPPDNRKHSSKSLVKRSCVGFAGVWGQKTQPRRGIHVFLRTRKTSLFTNPACLPDVLFDTAKLKNHGFYVVPCFPSLSSPTRGSPRLEITRKCCSKSLVKRSFETAAGQKRTRTMARWPGFGGTCPTGDPATEPL